MDFYSMRVNHCDGNQATLGPIDALIADIDIPDAEINEAIDRFYIAMKLRHPAMITKFPAIQQDKTQCDRLRKDCAVTMATAALASILRKEEDFVLVLDYFFAVDRSRAPRNKYCRACCTYILREEVKRLSPSQIFFKRLGKIEKLFANA